MSGWIKLHRKITEWEWWDDHNATRLFIYIITKANHRGKNWRGIEIKRGQFLSSLDKLTKETGISSQKIRTAIKRLKSTNEITNKSTSRYTIYTVNKYDLYQYEQQEDNIQNNKSLTNGQQTTNKQVTTTNNDKKIKKEKNVNKLNAKNTSMFEIEKEFRNKVYVYKGKYAPKLLSAFADHWTEPSHGGKKMKYQMERTFEIGRRLATWARNDFEGFQKEWIRKQHDREEMIERKNKELKAEQDGDTAPEEFKKFFDDMKKQIRKKVK